MTQIARALENADFGEKNAKNPLKIAKIAYPSLAFSPISRHPGGPETKFFCDALLAWIR